MNRVVSCSVTLAGAELARQLPYEHRHGNVTSTVAELWKDVDGLVVVAAMGVAFRAVAPNLAHKTSDPAVVCIDDSGRFVIPVCGGHAAGANRLARDIAGIIGAVPVITTATDRSGIPALDTLPGFSADGDLAAVTRQWLDGNGPTVTLDEGLEGWPIPPSLRGIATRGSTRVLIADRIRDAQPGEVVLRPRSLVLGAGSSSGADADALWELAHDRLSACGLDPRAVGMIATVDRKLSEPAIKKLAERFEVSLAGFEPALLAQVEVPNPSEAAFQAVGTASVAEAAALLGGGPGSSLLSPKTISASADSTIAIARRRAPAGHLAVVGLGPGHPLKRTPEATIAVRRADVVIGYRGYVDLVDDLMEPHHDVIRSPIGEEEDRCRKALKLAAEGHQVALVCSGDPGVYAMASLVCELAGEYGAPPLTVVPGVTAALSGASVLGAPLGHDHAAVSLSDLLTPWQVIEGRLKAVAAGDFVVSLYNPRSSRRTTQLGEALRILSEHRPASTPVAVLTDIGRPGELIERTVLSEVNEERVGMLSLVVVGSSSSRWIGDRMVTPRGYQKPER